MNFPVVFFTRTYLTNKRQGAGSGQFRHSYDVKSDEVLTALIDDGLLIGGNFIKSGRTGKEDLQYSSFCKQLPSTIKNNSRIQQAFEVNITTFHPFDISVALNKCKTVNKFILMFLYTE